MTLEQLKALVWVARLKGFGAAAEKLNTTQPGVSNRIRGLEDELGVTLFERTTRSVRITPEGKNCLEMAERILELAKDIKTSVGLRDHLTGSVRIGVSHTIAITWLPELMARLSSGYPLLEVDFEADATKSLFEKLSAGDVEILLCGGLPAGTVTRPYVIEELGCLEYSWMVGNDDNLVPPGDKPLRPIDLQALRIIAYTERSYLNDHIEAWFRQNGARVRKTIRCDDISTIASLVSANLGVGLIPASVFENRIARGEIRTIATTPTFPLMHHYSVYASGPDVFFPSLVAKMAKLICTFPSSPGVHNEATSTRTDVPDAEKENGLSNR
jgi:DNA-binding transcriptional LysR family regulator